MSLFECNPGVRAISWRWGWKLFLTLVASPSVGATFTHPRDGYTIWYPDGWYVHSQPQIAWAGSAGLRVETLGGQAEGFVASSCPPERYLP